MPHHSESISEVTLPNVKEIARLAGVSVGTVSHVLNGTAGVTVPLRDRVLNAVEMLGYQPNELARGLKTRTNMVGMIIPDIANPFFPAIVRGAEDAAFRAGLRLILCNADNDRKKESAYIQQLRGYRPTGILLISAGLSEITIESKLGKEQLAVVCIDREPANWHGDLVSIANSEEAEKATGYLLKCRHKVVGTITGPLEFPTSRERLVGFRRALDKAGVALSASNIQESTFDRVGGYKGMRELLALRARPTAVFVQADLIGIGALEAIRQAGLRCPEDISIISFDGLEISEFTTPTLTSIVQPCYKLGQKGLEMLLDRVASPSMPSRRVELPAEIRFGNSVLTMESQKRVKELSRDR